MDWLEKINRVIQRRFYKEHPFSVGDRVQHKTELGALNGEVIKVKRDRITVTYYSVNSNVAKTEEFFTGIWKKI